MLNIFKKKKRILVAVGIIILILIGIGDKIVMDKQIQSKQRQELALKDEKAIAQKIKNNFSGVKEVRMYSTTKLPSEPGGYECEYSVKYSWTNTLNEDERNSVKSINYDVLGKAKELSAGEIISDTIGAVHDSEDYLKYKGETRTPIKIIYATGEEEIL